MPSVTLSAYQNYEQLSLHISSLPEPQALPTMGQIGMQQTRPKEMTCLQKAAG